MIRTVSGVVLAIVCGVVVPCAPAASPCVAKAQDAVRMYRSGAEAGTPSADGYRVTRVRRDDVLPVSWAIVERCGHPDWPAVSVAMEGPGVRVARTEAVPAVVTVRAQVAVRVGDTVRVWRQDRNSRLEMAAVSDEGGAVGDRIRLHVASADGEPVRYCFGLVRGPANVEME